LSSNVNFEEIRAALRRGDRVDDRAFDAVYPLFARQISPVFWTPVEDTLRALKLLGLAPGARVLDVGSGVGKFCIVAAAATDARVYGVEHRPRLVDIAERAAAKLRIEVSFIRGTLEQCEPSGVDAMYFFNPFLENLCPFLEWIDGTVELSAARFARDIATARRFMKAARVGAKVVTFCGFGGEMPRGYERRFSETGSRPLELWVKMEDGLENRPHEDRPVLSVGR
jgi:SAM-dependent methyltransferase